ncbi:MAG: hypothetical protein PF447_04690 [Spirochaetaceae bacterium]|nr:hypothetical protein [Spirochaetaceae bacterium]
MKSKILKHFNATVTIYFIIAIFFLILQLFQLKSFNGVKGDIVYSGLSTKQRGLIPSRVRRIKLTFNGAELQLTPFERLKTITSDGIIHPLDFLDFQLQEDRIILMFDNDVQLNLISDIHSKKVTLRPELPLTIPPMERLLIPINWLDDFQLVQEDDILKLSRGEEENYFLTLPSESQINPQKNLDINVSNNILREVVLEETLSGTGRTLNDWFEKEGRRNLQDVYLREINQYQNLVFQSLKGRLLNNGYISDPQGENYFLEEAIIALLKESITRNQYPSLQAELAQSASSNRSRLSYYSAPFLGDIVTQGSTLISADWRQQSQMQQLLDNGDLSIFDYDDLFNFFSTQRSLDGELQRLEQLADKPSDQYNRINGQLTLLLDLQQNQSDSQRTLVIQEILNKQIIPNIFWIKEDLLLFDQQGIAQLEDSIVLGCLLIKYGNLLDEKLLAAGYKIVLSALKFQDDLGYIPQELIYSSNGDPEASGRMLPEKVYQMVTLSPYSTRRIDLSDELGLGSWAYTGASKFSLTSTPRETVINLDFPLEHAHHLVIRGVKPFYRIDLHGIKWKSDQNFQRYSDGWVYDEQRNILYLKVQHRRPTETIRILYYDPDAEAADTEEQPQREEESPPLFEESN